MNYPNATPSMPPRPAPPGPGAMDEGEDGQEPGELPVPLVALQQPDDSEQMQTPGEGDSVSFQVDAVITRVEGDCAYVKPSAVNGHPLPEEGEEPQDDGEQGEDGADGEFSALRQTAMQNEQA